MAIQSISYKKGFQVSLAWPKGVQGTILYALPHGAAPLSDDKILAALENKALLERICGYSYRAGINNIQYSPSDDRLSAKWIDIFYLDYSPYGEVMAHECAGSFFNGDCRVGFKIAYAKVSDRSQAVQILVQNLSGFEIAPGGIGYRVGGRAFPIPLALRPGERLQLPQFEIPLDAACEMHRFEEKYPARFLALET